MRACLIRIIFTDLKGEVDVNGSDVDAEDKNHSIVTSEDVLFGKYVNVPVEEAKQTTIDVSGILQQGFNTKNINELYQPVKLVSKVYDGAGIYDARGDYKKAVVTAADGTEAAKIMTLRYSIHGIGLPELKRIMTRQIRTIESRLAGRSASPVR